jgi:hypothetical protein
VIELIDGLLDAVIGIEAVGNVTLEDYNDVVAPVVERALANLRSIERIAVVTDVGHYRALVQGAVGHSRAA